LPTPRTTPNLASYKSLSDIEPLMPPAIDVLGGEGPHEYEFFRDCGEVPFESAATAYSAANAWYMSELAFLAYVEEASPAEVEAAVTPALTRMFRSVPEVKVFLGAARRWGKADEHDKIQCIVAHDATLGVVAFRGTLPKSIPNWLTDADFILAPEPGSKGGLVHQGFQGALDSVWLEGQNEGLEQYLAQVASRMPELRWWYTGHSLGAALATLAARRCGNAYALYAFGSPKVGNAAFVAEVNQSSRLVHRVVNHRDIVTRLPHSPQFEHVGELMHIEERTWATVAWLARLWDWLRRRFGYRPRWETIAAKWFDKASRLKSGLKERSLMRACLDHAPIFYSKILWNCLASMNYGRAPGATATDSGPEHARRRLPPG
jgi:triacylglycerol lipase